MPKKQNQSMKDWRERCRRRAATLSPETRARIIEALAKPFAEAKPGEKTERSYALIASEARANREAVVSVAETTRMQTIAKAAARLRFPTQGERQAVLDLLHGGGKSYGEMAEIAGAHVLVVVGIYEMNKRTVTVLRTESL